ncbi:MAG: hypothetical protein WBY53_11305 [Acidobacteriaceae bacterium]
MKMQNLDGIAEKLKRAKENFLNLQTEIDRFFQEGDYSVLPEHDRKLLFKAIEYHKNRVIPPRFSVLTGEVIHHLRSCFDHIVWHFSVGQKYTARQIEFPVFIKRPIDKEDCERFNRKIQGITDPNARVLIEKLQPYNAADPVDDPLWIIHDFDITDKHRELLLCMGTASMIFPIEMSSAIENYQKQHPELDDAHIAHHFKDNGLAMPCISFGKFGQKGIKPVVLGLRELLNHTLKAIKEFEQI